MFNQGIEGNKLLISVVGVGGCGCNTIDMLHQANLGESVNLVAVNTDQAVLNHMTLENKILIGETLTRGYGAGADPAVGYRAAEESEEALIQALKGSAIVIITAGFGGGTGTGASPYIAQLARELEISCLVVATLPFESESRMRMEYALQGVEDIKTPAQAYITLSNDLLLKNLGETVGLFSAFKQSNDVLKNLLSALVQMLTRTGMINVDINDFSRILAFEGESVLGVGKADTEDDAFDALHTALNNPLVNHSKIDTAKGAIVQICCKNEISLGTYEGLLAKVEEKLHSTKALIVAGVTHHPELTCEVEILVVASGITSGSENTAQALPQSNTSGLNTADTSQPQNARANALLDNVNTHDADYLNIPTFLRNHNKTASVPH